MRTGTFYWKNHSKKFIASSRVNVRKVKLTHRWMRNCPADLEKPWTSCRPGWKGGLEPDLPGIAGGSSKQYFPNVVGTYSSRTGRPLNGEMLSALLLHDLNSPCSTLKKQMPSRGSPWPSHTHTHNPDAFK